MITTERTPEITELRARLQRLAVFQRTVAAGLGPGTELAADLQWSGDALAAIERGEDPARALGLRRGPGQRSQATDACTRRRDELLRQARAEHFADLSTAGASRALLATAARVERLRTPPKPGTVEFAVVAAAGEAMIPTSPRRMRQILESSKRKGK